MRRRAGIRWLLPVLGALFLFSPLVHASPLALPTDPYRLCADAIARLDRTAQTPRHLLSAIALAESGRRHPATGAAVPWPWAVMAEGRGRYLETKADAIAEVRGLQARGIRNIDVGCMQINLSYHPDAFASLEQAFDPVANVAYAAQYLRELFAEEGSWPEAAGRYHSATPAYKDPYQERVMALWGRQRQRLNGDAADPVDDLDVASLSAPPRIAMPPLRQRQPTPAMINRFVRQLQMPTAAEASGKSTRTSRDQRRQWPLMADGTANDGLRDAAAAARFAERRAQYLQAWRDGVQENRGPVTVLRGNAEQVYTFDMR